MRWEYPSAQSQGPREMFQRPHTIIVRPCRAGADFCNLYTDFRYPFLNSVRILPPSHTWVCRCKVCFFVSLLPVSYRVLLPLDDELFSLLYLRREAYDSGSGDALELASDYHPRFVWEQQSLSDKPLQLEPVALFSNDVEGRRLAARVLLKQRIEYTVLTNNVPLWFRMDSTKYSGSVCFMLLISRSFINFPGLRGVPNLI